MTVRVEVVTPCEHGEGYRHPIQVVLKDHLGPGLDDVGYDWSNMCPGGSRRTFTEWPPEATEIVKSIRFKEFDGQNYVDSTLGHALSPNEIEELLTALWGHITGDNK